MFRSRGNAALSALDPSKFMHQPLKYFTHSETHYLLTDLKTPSGSDLQRHEPEAHFETNSSCKFASIPDGPATILLLKVMVRGEVKRWGFSIGVRGSQFINRQRRQTSSVDCLLRKPIPAAEIRGTADLFVPFYERLKRGTDRELPRMVENFLEALKRDLTIGVKIPRSLWPKLYLRKYGITNLWKYDVGLRYRTVYTIVAEGTKKVGIVIEFMDHEAYNERFGYSG